MHLYEGYHFGGMHLLWWLLWIGLIVWVFFTPWPIPGERKKENDPLSILQKKFAAGEYTVEEYQERKAIIEEDEKQTT